MALKPLPLSDANNGGAKPLSAEGVGEALPTTPDRAEIDDAVDKYMAEHPEAPPAAEPIAAEPVVAEPPKKEEPPAQLELKPGEEPVAAEPKPKTDVPAEPVPAEPKPAVGESVGEPVAAEPRAAAPTYSRDEKIAIGANADGTPIEWTRGQILDALSNERVLQPKAKDADSYRETFGMDAKQATEVWKPILAKLNENKPLQEFIDVVFASEDEGLITYLSSSLAYYAQQVEAGEVQPVVRTKKEDQYAKLSPEDRREIEETRTWRETQTRVASQDRFNRELSTVFQRYPFLATDKALLGELCLTAKMFNEEDVRAGKSQLEGRGLMEALQAKASIYDAIQIARSMPPRQDEPAPAATAVLGTGGASPGGTRTRPDNRPKKFQDAQDGVDDWIATHPE